MKPKSFPFRIDPEGRGCRSEENGSEVASKRNIRETTLPSEAVQLVKSKIAKYSPKNRSNCYYSFLQRWRIYSFVFHGVCIAGWKLCTHQHSCWHFTITTGTYGKNRKNSDELDNFQESND
jgi:hypothetical protein